MKEHVEAKRDAKYAAFYAKQREENPWADLPGLIPDELDWVEINVSAGQWEKVIDDMLEANEMLCIPEPVDNDWYMNLDHDDPIRAHVCDLTGILDPDILPTVLEEMLQDSKFAMAAGCTVAGNPQDPDSGEVFIALEEGAT